MKVEFNIIDDYIIPVNTFYIKVCKESKKCLVYNIYTGNLLIPTPIELNKVLLSIDSLNLKGIKGVYENEMEIYES